MVVVRDPKLDLPGHPAFIESTLGFAGSLAVLERTPNPESVEFAKTSKAPAMEAQTMEARAKAIRGVQAM